MTSFGKLLVYLNTFVAVILFGWAVSLYTNRVDWFDRTTEDGTKFDGQITLLQAEVKRFADQIKGTQAAYVAANAQLNRAEVTRDFHASKNFATMAEVKRVDDQVRFRELLRLPKSALLDVYTQGPVVNGLNGQPLQGLSLLRKKFDDLTQKTLAHQQTILKLRSEYDALSDQCSIVQAEVNRQKIIFNNLKDEQDYLYDARIHWEEQLRTLRVRQGQLAARLDALGVKLNVGTENK